MSQTAIFNTVSKHNYLGFNSHDEPEKIVDFLCLTKSDIAKVTGIAVKSIRYDERMPKELTLRLAEITNTCELVAKYFDGDLHKTHLWFQIKNPALGGISPRDMIRFGRYSKLVKFIQNALDGVGP